MMLQQQQQQEFMMSMRAMLQKTPQVQSEARSDSKSLEDRIEATLEQGFQNIMRVMLEQPRPQVGSIETTWPYVRDPVTADSATGTVAPPAPGPLARIQGSQNHVQPQALSCTTTSCARPQKRAQALPPAKLPEVPPPAGTKYLNALALSHRVHQASAVRSPTDLRNFVLALQDTEIAPDEADKLSTIAVDELLNYLPGSDFHRKWDIKLEDGADFCISEVLDDLEAAHMLPAWPTSTTSSCKVRKYKGQHVNLARTQLT